MQFDILVGDVREQLATLPDKSVHCVVTSPPYYRLRNYNIDGQIGLEQSVPEYLAVLVECFEEVKRVLRDDGTCWINIGDSYFGDSALRNSTSERFSDTWDPANTASRGGTRRSAAREGSLKRKDLMLIPERLAIALQDAGWYIRSRIIWAKPNPMPESTRDRPTNAHEHIWLLSKKAKYFYDSTAVRQPSAIGTLARLDQNIAEQEGSERANGGTRPGRPRKAAYPSGWRGAERQARSTYADPKAPADRRKGVVDTGANGRWEPLDGDAKLADGSNLKNVWNIAVMGFTDAHFATFPPALPRLCILAGTSAIGVCPSCGAPWERVTSRNAEPPTVAPSDLDRFGTGDAGVHRKIGGQYQKWLDANPVQTVRWQKPCKCALADPIPATVLDPFLGAGTTLLAADRLGRNGVGIELNPEYAAMARRRIESEAPLFAEVRAPQIDALSEQLGFLVTGESE